METARMHSPRRLSPLLIAAAVSAGIALGSADARAQADDNGGPGVIVDLGALSAGDGTAPFPSVRGGLLMPGPRAPVSQLHISAAGRPVRAEETRRPLRRPGAAAPRPAAPAAPAAGTSPSAPRLTAGTTVPKVAKPAPPPKPAKSPPAPLVAAKPDAEAAARAEDTKTASAPKEASGAPPAPPAPPAAPRTAVAKAPPPPPPMAETPAAAAAKPAESATPDKAAVPPAESDEAQRRVRIEFAADGTKLTGSARDRLGGVATRLKADEKLRLQLLAYAGGGELAASTARRLSLSRALAVRSYLIDSGVKSSRIDVRALGNKSTEGPPNRVDIDFVTR